MASKASLLMCDSTENYGPAEHVMDYIISYTLRLAKDISPEDTPILYLYIKNIISKLFEIELLDLSNIESIKVTKHWKQIDLVVELVLKNDNECSHVLLIENKHYSKIRTDKQGKNQLEKYKEKFEKKYLDKQLHYALISSQGHDEVKESYKSICDEVGFKCFSMDDLLPNTMKVPDGNDYHFIDSEDLIFNEFWLREWP